MSIYTETEHAIALTDTLHWIDHPPMTPIQRYLFGRYHYRLKDFNEAFHWFCLALSDHVEQAWFDLAECIRLDLIDSEVLSKHLSYIQINTDFTHTNISEYCYKRAWNYYSTEHSPSSELPENETAFRCGFLLSYGYGIQADPAKAQILFSNILTFYNNLTSDHFNICCDYSKAGISDGGTLISAPVEVCKLPVGSAAFELAKCEFYSIAEIYAEYKKDRFSHVRMLLKKAYDFHCEDALFFDYANFGQNYDTYEYQDDIRELFSFRIGQYTRVHDINPSVKALERLACMYENGYPGDDAERKKSFALKATPLRKKIDTLK